MKVYYRNLTLDTCWVGCLPEKVEQYSARLSQTCSRKATLTGKGRDPSGPDGNGRPRPSLKEIPLIKVGHSTLPRSQTWQMRDSKIVSVGNYTILYSRPSHHCAHTFRIICLITHSSPHQSPCNNTLDIEQDEVLFGLPPDDEWPDAAFLWLDLQKKHLGFTEEIHHKNGTKQELLVLDRKWRLYPKHREQDRSQKRELYVWYLLYKLCFWDQIKKLQTLNWLINRIGPLQKKISHEFVS